MIKVEQTAFIQRQAPLLHQEINFTEIFHMITPYTLRSEILFEDSHLIVLSKPAGLLSQGEKKGDPNLVDELRRYLGRPYVGLIHRLDRNTSGIMLVAKRSKSAQRLTQSLQDGKISRSYLAWVVGSLQQSYSWSHQLHKDHQKNRVRIVKEGGKSASLLVQPIENSTWQGASVTLAKFVLETGRSHQIRVQSAYEGFPLLGDFKYNPKSVAFPRVALHSYCLKFPHPMSGDEMQFTDPLPKDLVQVRGYK